MQEALRMERNKAYPEALQTWEKIRKLDPADPQADIEIQRLEDKRRQAQRMNERIQQLTRRLEQIRPIYSQVIQRLKQINKPSVEDATILGIVDDFLLEEIAADQFIQAWQALMAAPKSAITPYEPNYQALANRLKRGEQVEAELTKRQLELDALTAPTAPGASSTPSAQHVIKPTGPIEIFYSYSHKDEALRDKLETHLKILERQGIISGWHDRGIGAGTEWRNQINQHLEAAHIILLLISADFIASDYCWGKELERAMERHENGEARVIPIILREVDWSGAPFSKLQALPKDGIPVTSWPNQDEAFAHIARGIRAVSRELAGNVA
jgi:hypothetical protein